MAYIFTGGLCIILGFSNILRAVVLTGLRGGKIGRWIGFDCGMIKLVELVLL